MPNLIEASDLNLMSAGLASLECIERDGPILSNPLACMVISERTDFRLATLHDWSLPFLAKDFDRRGEQIWSEVQICHACQTVRAMRFGPYLGVLSSAEVRP